MIVAATYNMKGEVAEKTGLPVGIFGAKVDPTVVAQEIRVYLANQRQGNAKTKSRGEVMITTAKMYKQKGTGKARHGAASAPIFVGGGVAGGPTGEQNYSLRMPQKMKRLATLGALTEKANQKAVVVIVGTDKATGKTAQAAEWLKKVDLVGKKALVVVTNDQEKWLRAWKNLKKIEVCVCNQLNAYQISAKKCLVFTPESLEEVKKIYGAS
jgi:large subunit ribosomal protein L4